MSNNHFTPPQPGGGGSGITAVVQDPGPQLGGDLNCATNDISNATLIDSKSYNVDNGLTDAFHPGTGNFQQLVQSNGDIYNDVAGLGHFQLINTYNFPSGQQNLYFKKLPVLNEVVVARCRDASGQPIVVGGFRGSNFGQTFSFQDRLIYDPLAVRTGKIGNAWTRINVRPHLDNCFWKFECHFDIDWAAANPANRFRLQVDHFRGGVLLRTYDVFDQTQTDIKVIGSANVTINGAGLSEDVLVNDEFYFRIENMGPSDIANCRQVKWTIFATPRI